MAVPLLAACSSSPRGPVEVARPTAGQPTLIVLRVERRAEGYVIFAQLSNPGPETWTIETYNDKARARVQLPDKVEGGWEDCVLYDFCGNGVAWAELRPGESVELRTTAELDWKLIRLRIRMLRGAMRMLEGYAIPWPPDSDDSWSCAEPLQLGSD